MSSEKTVTISAIKYVELIDSQEKLNALENAGVDNWEWYSEALSDYWAARDIDEDEDD